MPYARKDILTWQTGMYYHIYNRGVSKSTIFREPKNYLFVIAKIKEYSLANNLAMIAYCLEPNHYHFLTRQDGDEPAGNLPQSVFNSYTKAYNKMYQHSGTLFEGRFQPSLFKPKAIYCTCADISTATRSKMVWSLTSPTGNGPITSNGSANVTVHWLTASSSTINLTMRKNIRSFSSNI